MNFKFSFHHSIPSEVAQGAVAEGQGYRCKAIYYPDTFNVPSPKKHCLDLSKGGVWGHLRMSPCRIYAAFRFPPIHLAETYQINRGASQTLAFVGNGFFCAQKNINQATKAAHYEILLNQFVLDGLAKTESTLYAAEASPRPTQSSSRAYYYTQKGNQTMKTRDEAFALLKQYNKEAFHIQHAEAVEGCMRYFANKLGYGDEADFWATVGLLHDIDFEIWPDEHCVKAHELLTNAGFDDRFIHAVQSHGYGMTGANVEPEHEMEKVLFAVDELTGIIGAAALMRPSKSVSDMELKSLKKKFKDKKFAAGCSRDVITEGAERLGWELDKLLEDTLEAMRQLEAQQ